MLVNKSLSDSSSSINVIAGNPSICEHDVLLSVSFGSKARKMLEASMSPTMSKPLVRRIGNARALPLEESNGERMHDR